MHPLHHRLSSFTYLNLTQFLGALNDNIYKLLIVFFLIQLEGMGESHRILALTGATFVLPFLLFSAISGILADRFSKRDIIVTTKILELVIIGFAVFAFAVESRICSYVVLFLLATQSAIFGPSKYGIVPELVPTENISRANGLMTSLTFLAIVLGTFLASFLSQITGRNFIVSAIFCTFIALVGVVTSFCIEETPPSGSKKKLEIFFWKEIWWSLNQACKHAALLPAMLGSAYFLFVGAFAQLNIIPFAVQSLGLSDIEGGYLFFLTAIGIGTGSLIAGKISGKGVELGLVPLGAAGMALTAFLLNLFANTLSAVVVIVTLLGVFGGIFEIPLDSYIQITSPKEERGQMVAATNFMSFIGVLFASGLVFVNAEWLGLPPDRGFSIIGGLTLGVGALFAWKLWDRLANFVKICLWRLCCRAEQS